ncbi:MEMAR_RS02690 family S-layer glycoprotein [Methanoculleus taiwanensis]|uniref:MEMAR_RS02690 family S-layer glycoprotein n=1 Tax=Methanoculleus taiwanensis TaxID=1550565 RepID=UPI0013E8A989|nr:MEMAR_RS02690 family S-layer glycoprotein [Methanoculleus taiwanensis]
MLCVRDTMRNHEQQSALLLIGLLAIALLASPAAARDGLKGVSVGDAIYVGEDDLDLTGVAPGITRLVHYSDFTAGSADSIIDVANANDFDLSAESVGGTTGTYYAWDNAGLIAGNPFVIVKIPVATLDVVLNDSRTDSVNGKSVSRGTPLAFELQNNLGGLYATPAAALMDIEVTTPVGGRVTQFGGISTAHIPINRSKVYVGGITLEDTEAGTYTAQARWNDQTGLAEKGYDSNTICFEVVVPALSLAVDKESVIRNHNFAVTISGESKKTYWLYVRDAGLAGNQYPLIAPGQPSVTPGVNMPGVTDLSDYTYTKAAVITNAAGTRTVQFNTTAATANQGFTIRVVDPINLATSERVTVAVTPGSVSLTASGTGVYYIGEELVLSGTNTDSMTTYLFLCGPNLAINGVKPDNWTIATMDGAPATFTRIGVRTDDTWEYRWDTSAVGGVIDSGYYTIYAVSAPRDKAHLSGVQYATASFVLKSPSVMTIASSHTLAKGDDLTVSGTATGNPDNVYIWIFGKNYHLLGTPVNVASDDSFEYNLENGETENLRAGQYFVVVQHPMTDGEQDVRIAPGTTTNITGPDTPSVNIANLPASDAAIVLVNALSSRYVDDTYATLTFFVEEPWIRIDAIGHQSLGSTFSITGTTNLAPGDELLIGVTSASFKPSETTQYYGYSGASGTIAVRQGVPNNTWSFDVDASQFLSDRYNVFVESVETGVWESTAFTLGDGPYPIPTPDPVYPDSTGYAIRSAAVSPPDARMFAGDDVTATVRVGFMQKFNESASFEVYTDLTEPCWNFYLYRDDILVSSQTRGGNRIEITAFELSYSRPIDLTIRLHGTVPGVGASENRTLFRTRILDAGHAPVENATFTIFREFVPAPPPTPVSDGTINLTPGWNFVSVPRALSAGNDTAAIFAGVDTGGRSIFLYNASERRWHTLQSGSVIRPLDGIWIYANVSMTVPLYYASGSVSAPAVKGLSQGWNAVGHPCTVPASARDAFSSVQNAWTNLIGWNASVQQYDTAVINGGSGIFADSRTLQPCRGYWLYVTGSGELAGMSL